MQVTIGGERLGTGKKNQISLKHYERSTHDLSQTLRTTMASGTLVPFLNKIMLPGDTFDIEIDLDVKTLPTLGPLFGSYKIEAHVFTIPMRLYNAKTNMNMLDIGMNMQNIKFPKFTLKGINPLHSTAKDKILELGIDNLQVNSSSLLSYLGVRGLGKDTNLESPAQYVERKYNGMSLLAYWDIYKNYYANKQEDKAYFISGNIQDIALNIDEAISHNDATGNYVNLLAGDVSIFWDKSNYGGLTIIDVETEPTNEYINRLYIIINNVKYLCVEWWDNYEIREKPSGTWEIVFWGLTRNGGKSPYTINEISYNTTASFGMATLPNIKSFDLKNIDNAKVKIYSEIESPEFDINENLTFSPYKDILETKINQASQLEGTNAMCVQDGLALKTYMSDKFNNWVDTEWIEGENGIAAVTSIDTTEGAFTLDELRLKTKVYNMLMRIAVSGGTYDDYLEATYDHNRIKEAKSPVYEGGLIREIAFQEVLSQTENEQASLGSMGGRGILTDRKKGGKMIVKTDEPCILMGIVSITPRIDYSQGNDWSVNLDNYDDLHKPELDGIGFQDLITDEMAWFDTDIRMLEDISGNITAGSPDFKSAGKVPAWLNYMTSVNEVKGNFANEEQMFCVLNRRYEFDGNQGIKDLTTYIDPSKFNHVFAQTRLDAQNFMVQIRTDITARRKMSAKLMPNL